MVSRRIGRLQAGPRGAVVEMPDGEIIELDNIIASQLECITRELPFPYVALSVPQEYRLTVECIPTIRYGYDNGYQEGQATDITDVQEIGSGPKLLPERTGE